MILRGLNVVEIDGWVEAVHALSINTALVKDAVYQLHLQAIVRTDHVLTAYLVLIQPVARRHHYPVQDVLVLDQGAQKQTVMAFHLVVVTRRQT